MFVLPLKGNRKLDNNTSNKAEKALPLFFYTAIFAATAIVVQGMAVVFGYDPVMQVYKLGSVVGKASGFILFAEIVIFSLLSILMLRGKNKLVSLPDHSDVTAFLSAAAGCVIVASSFILFYESRRYFGNVHTVTSVMAILSIPAGASFILPILNKKSEGLISYFGFFPIIWASTCLLRIYFDVGAAINDPIRILFQVSFAAVMLALLFEQKVRIGKGGTIPLIIFSGVAIILGLASVLSMTLLFIIPKTVTAGEILLSTSQLLICLDLFVKMYSELKEL